MLRRTFQRVGDRIRWRLDAVEVDLLRTLTSSLGEVLQRRDPADDAIRRLFPRAVSGVDAEAADAELRALIHDDLAGVKRAGLDALDTLLDRATPRGREHRVLLDADDALLVLGVLNDLRLAIGARVGIAELDRDDVAPDSPVAYRLAVMDHLAGWQELLLALVDPPSVRIDPFDVDALGLDEGGG